MSSDHSASSSRNGGGGLCKALKEMKSKVATHTGMSLSFVELVSTSPAVGLLPALPPSPRSPSALLHRRMNFLGNYSFVARKSSPTELSTCENMDRQSMCNAELEPAQSSCATTAVDGDTRPGIKLSCVSPMPSDVSYKCEERDVSSESPSLCNLANGHPLSSSCACSLASGHHSSTSLSCDLLCGQPSLSSSCALLSWEPSLSSLLPSSSSCHVLCGHPSSYSSCDLHPSSSASTCSSPCGHPSSSSSCDLACGHSSSSSLSRGRQLVSSSLLSCDLLSGSAVSDMCTPYSDKFSPNICKHAATITRVTSQIPSISARVLYFIVTLIFALSSVSKSFDKFSLWISRCVLHPDMLLHYIRVMISAGFVNTKSDKLSGVEDGGCGNEMEDLKVDVSVGHQSLHSSKTNCMKRSKLLKSKLRSSFKSLSVQVPRKAFAPLHFNTFPHSCSSSSSSSISSSSSMSSSPLSAINNSPTARKTQTLESPVFACKLSKSFNQRQPMAVSQISLVLTESRMCGSPTSRMVCSHPSSCGFKQHSPNRAISLNRLGESIVVPLVAIPLALCALFYGKFVAFIAVTAWLVVVSIASSVCFLWRTFFQICSRR